MNLSIHRRALLGAIFVTGLVASALAQPSVSSTQRRADVNQLAWLGGCWELRTGPRVVEEQWMAPRGGMMLGMSRTLRGDTVVEFEQLRIFQRGARAVYAAAPSGQAPAEFEAAATSDSLVVFENPAHDFPQRIIYRRRGLDSLIARIEGIRGGVVRGTDFPYGKRGCGE